MASKKPAQLRNLLISAIGFVEGFRVRKIGGDYLANRRFFWDGIEQSGMGAPQKVEARSDGALIAVSQSTGRDRPLEIHKAINRSYFSRERGEP